MLDTVGLLLLLMLIPSAIGSLAGLLYHAVKKSLSESVYWRALWGMILGAPCALAVIWSLGIMFARLTGPVRGIQGISLEMMALLFAGGILAGVLAFALTLGLPCYEPKKNGSPKQTSKTDW